MVSLTYVALAVTAITGAFATPTADTPDFVLGRDGLARRLDYNQKYETSGNVNFSPSSSGYSVQFSGAGDFVVGKGWTTGKSRQVYPTIQFDGSTTHNAGTVIVSVYGWSKNPLVEYYVQEYASNGSGSAQGTHMGTVECDGSTYDIYQHQQVGQPSIEGSSSTFNQYISKRKDQRSGSGTITTSCHFMAWKKLGLELGTMDYQVLATEAWGSAGGSSKYTITG